MSKTNRSHPATVPQKPETIRECGGMSLAVYGGMRILAFTSAILVLTASAAHAIVNNCADPLWQDTLRCKVSATPYTTLGPPTEVKAFTRVFLRSNPALRCLDGTAPILYVDKAVGPTSNRWLFTFQGGGSCAPVDTDGNGVVDDASGCTAAYTGGEAGEMGTGDSKQMKSFFGVHSADPIKNPVFAGYNRVRIDKCSFDRYNGRASWVAPGGALSGLVNGVVESFDVYNLGYAIITAALDELLPGITYPTWRKSGGAILETTETLPPLSDATTILFIGHSGGGHGLIHNIDHLGDDLAARGVTADVRALIDAHFTLSQENEAAFIGAGDLYDHVWTGTTSGDGDVFTYDGAYWSPGGAYNTQLTTYAAELDESCVDAHPADPWKCFDHMHVLLNHVSTPFFIREDFSDSNHSNRREDHVASWGPHAPYAHCNGVPCAPKFTVPVEHRPRLDEQATRLWYDFPWRSELATNLDTSLGGTGLTPSFAIWMPDCGVHEGAYDDRQFFGVSIDHSVGSRTMRSLLESFMTYPRTGLRSMYRDDWADSAGYVSQTAGCN